MPPKRGARGGATKRTAPVAKTPEKAKEEAAEAKEEKEEINMDEMQVMDEVKDEGDANGDEEAAGEEAENGEEEAAEGEGEEGGEGEETAETAEAEGEAGGEGGEKKEGEESKDEKKEGNAKDGKKEPKKKPRFNPHNRTVAVHEYHVDRMNNVHERTVMIGPTNLEDLQNEKLISYLTNKAVQFFIRYACKPEVKGHVEIRFKTSEEAQEAAEDLRTIREGLIANQNNEEFQGSDKAKELKNLWGSHDEGKFSGSAAQRTLVLKGLPKDVTLEQLEEKIPDATQIIMPHRGSPATFPGFCYVEFPTAELVDKKLKEVKEEDKLKFPDPENPEEEKEAVFRKFDIVPHSDLLIKKIDTQHFEKSFMSIPGDGKQEMLNQFISACAYFERNSFLLRQKRLETIKKKKQMLIQRRDEIRKMQRAQNRKNRNMNRGGRTGGRGGSSVSPRGAPGAGRGGRNDRGGYRGGNNNDRRPMKRFQDRSPRGPGAGIGGKRMRRDSYGRDDRGPMPSGPRIPREAWQSNSWNSGGGSWNNGGGMGGGSFGNSGMGMGGGGGNFMGGGMRGSGMDMGYGGTGAGGMGRMDYNSASDYYDDGSMRGSMGGGGGMSSYGTGGGYSSNIGEYDDMGQDSYGAGNSYGSGGVSSYNDGYDSYSTSASQGRKSSLNPQQAANAVNLLVGLSSLMGNKNQSGAGATGGSRYGTGTQKGGRWGSGRN